MSKIAMPKADLLQLVALAISGIGYLVTNEIRRRETEEIVREVIAEREQVVAQRTPPSVQR